MWILWHGQIEDVSAEDLQPRRRRRKKIRRTEERISTLMDYREVKEARSTEVMMAVRYYSVEERQNKRAVLVVNEALVW